MKRVLFVLLLVATGSSSAQVRLQAGMVITQSVTIEPGDYFIAADSAGAIVIRGSNIEVDFAGARLFGSLPGESPDKFSGVGIRVEPGSDVTIRNATVRGYKVGLLARDMTRLHVTESDFSYNWRQRLRSTLEREHLDDWMSYHTNETDEWLRYGAAVYLNGCTSCVVDRVTITGGQNGLMLTNVTDSRAFNNAITFNSSIGIGLYRSSRNRIESNRLDYNVRGYSHGVYNRGQDSAALLVYEQSNDNIFAGNSATHSGDGFFLWAGQSTMDSGVGGCNNNLIVDNDFSFAPTNGIEVTFSTNTIIRNRMEGCWHGIWGGYSWDTLVQDNVFIDNEEHIAVEHGQALRIVDNLFVGGDIGIRLWERTTQPDDWGYSKARDVLSQDHVLERNRFSGTGRPVEIRQSRSSTFSYNQTDSPADSLDIKESDVVVADNTALMPGVLVSSGGTSGSSMFGSSVSSGGTSGSSMFGSSVSSGGTSGSSMFGSSVSGGSTSGSSGDRSVYPETGTRLSRLGREYILVDEWGPHDFRSPRLWPRSARNAAEQWFEVVGPPGQWSLSSASGVESMSVESGSVGDSILVRLNDDHVIEFSINLVYVGAQVIDRFGTPFPEGAPFAFGYDHFFVPIQWDVAHFAWDDTSDPRTAYDNFLAILDGPALNRTSPVVLGIQAFRSPAEGVPADRYATRAIGTLSVPKGHYRLDVTSDDGVRVWIDERLVHDDWTWHPPRLAEIELDLDGAHTIRIDHFEIDGYSSLVAGLSRMPN